MFYNIMYEKEKYYYKHVYDSEYAKEYYRKNKEKVHKWTKKWESKNKEHLLNYRRKWARENKDRLKELRDRPESKEKRKISAHNYWVNHQKGNKNYYKIKKKQSAIWAKNNPVKFLLSKRLSLIKQRCINSSYRGYKYYGGKGIKCFLSFQDMVFLWERDKATKMEKPSVDRINPDGNYELSNCRFLEFHLNRPRPKNRVK